MVKQKQLKILELFSGTASFSNIAKERSVIPPKLCIEILTKLNDGNDGIPPKPKDLGILPTIIWNSANKELKRRDFLGD